MCKNLVKDANWPRSFILIISLFLLLIGGSLFIMCAGLNIDQELLLVILKPLVPAIRMGLTTFSVTIVITAAVGLVAAAKVTRYTTALVSSE